ncbi:hypothetical protein ACN9ML_31485 [Dyadobacter endophyticus]|uniref:Uncharacterized protein n=1 Tax=Dyadobacter endophyticus TaxID=1749036 RepID=A0ABQ1YRJ8_9BACT|nr:hypothetical protein [Dyadobacter endophyticus]GGH34305.1 hypothetical protein GCM10007423_25120 [Dyadobacter endophyticus]
MAQLLQNIYNIAPMLVIIALFGAAAGGFWLVLDLNRKSAHTHYSISERLFLKRNANRLRKIHLH